MQIIYSSEKNYSREEIKNYFSKFNIEAFLINLSKALLFLYNKKMISEYYNSLQLVSPSINAIYLFGKLNGGKTKIATNEIEIGARMVLSIEGLDLLSPQEELVKCETRANLFTEDPLHNFSRAFNLSVYIDKKLNNEGLKIKLNFIDFYLILFGSYALSNYQQIPIIDENFFKNFNYEQEKAKSIKNFLEEELTYDIQNAKQETSSIIETPNDLIYLPCLHAFKPFLKIKNGYLLTCLGYSISNAVSIYARYLIKNINLIKKGYGNNLYGEAFEKYIRELIKENLNVKFVKIEPCYKGKKNQRGVDIAYLLKRRPSCLIEISKIIPNNEIKYSFNETSIKDFLKNRIQIKFHQMFNWLNSYDGVYDNYQLQKEYNNTFFIVITSEQIPGIHTDKYRKMLIQLVQESWEEFFTIPFPHKNIFLLSAYELETCIAYSNQVNQSFMMTLKRYSKFLDTTNQVRGENGGLKARESLLRWLIDNSDKNKLKEFKVISKSFKELNYKARGLLKK